MIVTWGRLYEKHFFRNTCNMIILTQFDSYWLNFLFHWEFPHICPPHIKLTQYGLISKFLKNFSFVLAYSWLTMLWQFHVNSEGTHPYRYMHPFSSKLPSHPGCHLTLSRVPCAVYSRTLLVIHFKYSSVDMSIPNFQTSKLSFPPSFPHPRQPKIHSLSQGESFCFVSNFICISSF